MNLSWMMWTWQTALFFLFIFGAIAFNGVLAVRGTSPERKGFLPISTTPGDRLFIGLITSIIVLLTWLALFGAGLVLVGAIIAVVWFAIEAKFG